MKVSALIAIFLGAIFSRAQDGLVFGPPLDIRDNRELGNFNNVFVAETPSPKVKRKLNFYKSLKIQEDTKNRT